MTQQATTNKKSQLAALLEGLTAGDREDLIRSMGVEVVPTTATVLPADEYKGKEMVQILVPGARPKKMTRETFVRLFVTELADVIRTAKTAGIIV